MYVIKSKFLITLTSNFSDVYSHKYTNIKISSGDDLPLAKTNMHNLVILIKIVFNKNYNHHYYYVILEIFSYR